MKEFPPTKAQVVCQDSPASAQQLFLRGATSIRGHPGRWIAPFRLRSARRERLSKSELFPLSVERCLIDTEGFGRLNEVLRPR